MNIIKINSSQIDLVSYCHATRELCVRFQSGGLYSYADVPSAVVGEFVFAGSPGKKFAETVKSGPYAYAKLGADSEIANRMNKFAAGVTL